MRLEGRQGQSWDPRLYLLTSEPVLTPFLLLETPSLCWIVAVGSADPPDLGPRRPSPFAWVISLGVGTAWAQPGIRVKAMAEGGACPWGCGGALLLCLPLRWLSHCAGLQWGGTAPAPGLLRF